MKGDTAEHITSIDPSFRKRISIQTLAANAEVPVRHITLFGKEQYKKPKHPAANPFKGAQISKTSVANEEMHEAQEHEPEHRGIRN